METTDPSSHLSSEAPSPEEGNKLDISPVVPAQIEPQDAHWLRMDPSLTRSVLAKTEEELLGSLAALMRNKVEYEQVSRRFAQIQIDSEQAKHQLETQKEQIRRSEEEVATRLAEQTRINEEIVRVRQELAELRGACQQHSERVASLKNEVGQTQEALAEAHRNLLSVKEATATQLAAHRETIAQLAQVRSDKAVLEEALAPLQVEVDERIMAREALIAEQRALHAEVAALHARLQELAEAAEKAEQARNAEGLPLLFGAEAHYIAPEWDPYPLESEFHTDEALDAKMVAKLVSMLPGLEGCLIVRNHGPVLASQMPERFHAHLKVPDRNYHLLFERLERKVEEFDLQHARLATFDLGTEGLTVAQANHAFVFVNHRQAKLQPGMPGKLASIVSELAKMYP